MSGLAGQTPRQRLEAFAEEFRCGRSDAAFAILDALIAEFPGHAPLYWQRARALRALGRVDEALVAVNAVIERKKDFAPAFALRAQLLHGGGSAESDLKRAVTLDPSFADAHVLYARLLIGKERLTEADAAIAAGLAHHPTHAPLLIERAHVHAQRAQLGFGDSIATSEDTIALTSGYRASRRALTAAADDFRQALALAPQPPVRIELARVLDQLGDHNAALEELAAASREAPAGGPLHQAIAELSERIGDGGAGESQRLEQLAAASAAPESVEPTALTVSELRERLGEARGLDKIALDLCLSVYALAYPLPLELAPAEAARFPKFMREFAATALAAMSAHGYRHIADVDAVSFRDATGQPTLLRIFASADGVTCAAAYRTEPRRPGWWQYWLLRLLGKWPRPAVIDLETAFDDGGFLVTTNTASTDPFGYRGAVDIVKLLPEASLPALMAKHRERIERYRREHPNATAQRVDTLEKIIAMQRRLAEVKARFRRSIGLVEENELRQLLGAHYDTLRPLVREQLERVKALVG